MNTIFATSAVRRVALATFLALGFVLLTLTAVAHPAHAACNSRITSVSNFNAYANQKVTISGQCLGTNNYPPYKADSYDLYIHVYNGTQSWNACYVGDGVTCSVQFWGPNEIVFSGFAGYYGSGPYQLRFNEAIVIEELNPQNPVQWSKCTVYVGYASSCLNQLAPTYHGSGHNITVNLTSNLALSIQENQQEHISGYATWTAPLYGSGPFTGQMYDNGVVMFTSTASDGSGTTIAFTGEVSPYGSISGSYSVDNGYQIGTWEVSPA